MCRASARITRSMCRRSSLTSSFISSFFQTSATTKIYTLSLHDALPIFAHAPHPGGLSSTATTDGRRCKSRRQRSEEHTSELQSHSDLVCRLLLEKKKSKNTHPLDPATQHDHAELRAAMKGMYRAVDPCR